MSIDPERNTFSYLVERFGDRQATRYQEASFNIQPKENFHYRPTWDPDQEIYDPDYTALKLTDPYSYTDPRQYYYTPYVVANAADRHESFAQTLKYIEDRRLLDKLPGSIGITVSPASCSPAALRTGRTADTRERRAGSARARPWSRPPGSPRWTAWVTPSSSASSGWRWRVGRATRRPRRRRTGCYARSCRALRKVMEELLVERDWAVGVIGLDLIDELLHPVVFEHLDDRALARGAVAYSQLARHFDDWYRQPPQVS